MKIVTGCTWTRKMLFLECWDLFCVHFGRFFFHNVIRVLLWSEDQGYWQKCASRWLFYYGHISQINGVCSSLLTASYKLQTVMTWRPARLGERRGDKHAVFSGLNAITIKRMLNVVYLFFRGSCHPPQPNVCIAVTNTTYVPDHGAGYSGCPGCPGCQDWLIYALACHSG